MSEPTLKSPPADIKRWVTQCVLEDFPNADVEALWSEGLKTNALIAKMLREKADKYKNMGDKGRFFSHVKAARAISEIKVPVVSGEMARKIPFIGESMEEKIDEFIKSGRAKPIVNPWDVFMDVWGVAGVQARAWYSAGYRSIDDVRADPPTDLTEQQRLGLKYYEQLKDRVPRDTITHFYELVKDALPNATIEIGGSYRREVPTSGDVDVLIMGATSDEVARAFEEAELTVDVLKHGTDRYTAVMTDGESLFKVDVFIVPKNEWAPALLYVTGSMLNNLAMRGKAKRMGMLLNQHGLYKISGDEHILIPTKTERDIFDALGMKYLEPRER